MWRQFGSKEHMGWNDTKDWVRNLNSREYAGYHDWRLPTVEEAASLLESGKNNRGLYIAPLFSNMQNTIWTGDEYGLQDAWLVDFYYGNVYMYSTTAYSLQVLPVRSINN